MSKEISEKEVAAWLEPRDNYLILTHIRPDGDTLGCAGGLAQGLRELGKTAYLLKNHEVTPRYVRFFDDYWAPDNFTPEFVISVDTATKELLPKNASPYIDDIALCIDHHGTNTMYAKLVCCQPDTAACGEIIYSILKTMTDKAGIKISSKTADCLYVAISTDTGCFCYRNTTADTHRTAAELIELGAAHKEINKSLFRTKRRGRITLDSLVTSSMEYFFEGKVAIVMITQEMMENSGADENDIDDISNVASSIEGVVIGITIREITSPTDCKISVRASPPYNASELCKKFGGGGHKAAAGATMKKGVQEIKEELLAALQDYEF